ncbi:MAG: FMN-binding protein [Spirochaetaceae bacterium]|nr:MAG: FMN-binding protein [Spirochaetaceae bacterium]
MMQTRPKGTAGIIGTALLVLTIFVLAGCGGDRPAQAPAQPAAEAAAEAAEPAMPEYADGIYFAQEADFSERSGWKYMVTLVVEGGRIVDAEWNGAHRGSGTDKLTRDRDGEYGMKENSSAQWHWYEQAEATVAYLLETQDTSLVSADAISGATITVDPLFTLAEKALAQGPSGYGPWRDGYYTAGLDRYSATGWKDTVGVTVVAGRIVAVNWDALAEEGGTNKKQLSMDGEYGMYGDGPAQWPWWEQAQAAERHLLETQDLDNLVTDAVSGATIRLGGFESVVKAALADARR